MSVSGAWISALIQQERFSMRRLLPFFALAALLAASSVALAATEIETVSVSANGLTGTALALKAASAFTQPGTAAGSASVTVTYILV